MIARGGASRTSPRPIATCSREPRPARDTPRSSPICDAYIFALPVFPALRHAVNPVSRLRAQIRCSRCRLPKLLRTGICEHRVTLSEHRDGTRKRSPRRCPRFLLLLLHHLHLLLPLPLVFLPPPSTRYSFLSGHERRTSIYSDSQTENNSSAGREARWRIWEASRKVVQPMT